MKDCCSFPLSLDSPTTYIFSLFYVFSPILNGPFCRMDDAEACFILSSRNEVDRMAAVRNELTQIVDSVARSRCKKAPVFIRTIRQSWEPGQWRTLPQTAPFMFRYSNRKISSMSNLQVSLFRQSFYFFHSNSSSGIWHSVLFCIFSRSCCVWGGVQIRHVGAKLHLSRHLHPDHAARTHLQRTVSLPARPTTFPGSFVRLQRSNFFRFSCLMMWNMIFLWSREVNELKQTGSLSSLWGTAGSRGSTMCQQRKLVGPQWLFLGCVFFCEVVWKANWWEMIFHSVYSSLLKALVTFFQRHCIKRGMKGLRHLLRSWHQFFEQWSFIRKPM